MCSDGLVSKFISRHVFGRAKFMFGRAWQKVAFFSMCPNKPW
jgi:hypothetical protein